jgi:hypothetical protein|tara:strand:+ start:219 stop:413 length:195 start_codon:yes stop_codon:yes gene_type:complete
MANGDYDLRNYYYQVGLMKATEMEIKDIIESEDFAEQYEQVCMKLGRVPEKFGYIGGKIYADNG